MLSHWWSRLATCRNESPYKGLNMGTKSFVDSKDVEFKVPNMWA